MGFRWLMVVLIASATFNAAPLGAQASHAIAVEEIAKNFLKITVSGPWDATVLAFTGPDGLLVVDSGFKGTATQLKRTLDGLGFGPPRYLINTHSHKDHTGGNDLLGREALVVGHEELKAKLRMGSLVLEDFGVDAQPDIGIEDRAVLYFNGEEVVVRAIGGGHDSTDLVVWFKDSGIAYLGDLAYGMHYPSTDYYTGSLLRYPAVISELLAYLPPETRIVSGHGADYSHSDMARFRDMLVETQVVVTENLEAGLTAQEIVADGLLEEWESFSHPGMMDTGSYVGTLARDLRQDPMPTKNILGALYDVSQRGGGVEIQAEFQRIKSQEAEAYGLAYDGFTDVVIGHVFSLGRRLAQDQRFGDALDVFGILLDEYPALRGGAALFNEIGEAHLEIYEFDAAREAFSVVVERVPDHPNATARLRLLGQLSGG